jgi:hypothetical protein
MPREVLRRAELCPRPDKHHYRTREIAYEARGRGRRQGLNAAKESGVYRCECGLWCIGRDHVRKKRR